MKDKNLVNIGNYMKNIEKHDVDLEFNELNKETISLLKKNKQKEIIESKDILKEELIVNQKVTLNIKYNNLIKKDFETLILLEIKGFIKLVLKNIYGNANVQFLLNRKDERIIKEKIQKSLTTNKKIEFKKNDIKEKKYINNIDSLLALYDIANIKKMSILDSFKLIYPNLNKIKSNLFKSTPSLKWFMNIRYKIKGVYIKILKEEIKKILTEKEKRALILYFADNPKNSLIPLIDDKVYSVSIKINNEDELKELLKFVNKKKMMVILNLIMEYSDIR